MKKYLVIVACLAVSFLVPNFVFAQSETGAPPVQQDRFYRGQVESVLKEGEVQEYGQTSLNQFLRVIISEGPLKGTKVEIPYQVDIEKKDQKFQDGQQIVVGVSDHDPEVPYYVSDVYRLNALWFIVAFFFILTVVLARMQGFRAFLGLAISFVIITFLIVPLILKGWNPLWVSLIGSLGIASVTLYVAHGFHMRTTVAFVSILSTLSLAAFFSWLFVVSAKLFGFGTEEAFFLQNAPDLHINLRGLLLGGMLIGTLGVLDDVATAQAATVEEIHKANTSLGFGELYARGLSVGREHIVSLVNTLVLAYTGASFPLLLLFSIYQKPAWTILNSEMMAEEVVRMIVGSIALMLAVPITTALAAFVFSHSKAE